jgi:hypothetical protein
MEGCRWQQIKRMSTQDLEDETCCESTVREPRAISRENSDVCREIASIGALDQDLYNPRIPSSGGWPDPLEE